MIIYPAIDLRKGQCIRLYQGKYENETVYSTDPFATASTFRNEGANWLHIVDLDGAKDPQQSQIALIAELIRQTHIQVQIGGGIRSKAQIAHLLKLGAARVILGSLAVKMPFEVAEWMKYFGPERIVLALDVVISEKQQPLVAVNAWQNESEYQLFDLIEYYLKFGLIHLLCTNISLDGTLQGPDFALYDSVLEQFPMLKLQASGGIHSTNDLLLLRKKNLAGAIVGRALYEKKISLAEILSC